MEGAGGRAGRASEGCQPARVRRASVLGEKGWANTARPSGPGMHTSLVEMPPASPTPRTSSTEETNRRPPSFYRCTMRFTAWATRMAVSFGSRCSGAATAYMAMRSKTPAAESAWMVHIEPSLP